MMSRYLIPPEELSSIDFKYDNSPPNQQFIRLLTLLPGVGGGDPLIAILSTHVWDAEKDCINHAAEINTANPFTKQGMFHGEKYPSSVHEEIKSLTCCSSDEQCLCLRYEALSYEWKDDDNRYRICLNGQIFAVTRNLEQALFHLRHAKTIRRLWVDAICINQKDDIEKSKQIRLMDRIYKTADRVIAWLGLAVRNGNLAFDFAEKLYASARSSHDLQLGSEGELQDGRAYLAIDLRLSLRSPFMHSAYAREWLALHWLFKRPYWVRGWIFQELLLAKRLLFVCGLKSTTWGVMQHAMHVSMLRPKEIVNLINSSMPIPDQDTLSPATAEKPHGFHVYYQDVLLGVIEGRHYMKNYFTTQSTSHTTERWLELIHTRVCKYRHDLVYSILGIVPRSVANSMAEPNYKQPVTETFKQFAKAFIVGARSLNILCYSHHSDSQDDLPSWVFDWGRESRLTTVHDFAGYIGTKRHRRWHSLALAYEKYTPTFSGGLSTISVHGIIHGTVSKIKLEYELFPNMRKIAVDVEEKDVFGVNRCHHTMHQRSWWRFEDDARALLGDAPPDLPSLQNDEASTLLYLFLSKEDQIRFSNHRTQKQTRWGKANNFEDVYDAMQSTTKSRTVFRTDKGELGLAPMWTKPEDVVCQFLGCTAAVILRESGNQTYRLVGDCYVLGKAGEEAIRCLEDGREKDSIRRFMLI